MKKDNDKEVMTASEVISGKTESFLAKNGRLLLIIAIVAIAAVLIAAVVTVVSGNRDEELAIAAYNVEDTYNTMAALTEEDEGYAEARDAFLAAAEPLADDDGMGYAYLKANYLMGMYNFGISNWSEALSSFDLVADAANGTYMGSLALANAAAAAENNGDQGAALAYWQRLWDDYGTEAAEAPRALFNTARIYEAQGDNELAAATYSQLRDEFPASEYAGLATSRLMVL